MSNEEVRDAVQVAIEVLGKIRILQIHVLSEDLMPDTSIPYVTDARTAIANLRSFRLKEIRKELAGIDSPLDLATVPFPASSAFDAVVRVVLNLGPCLDILEPHLRTYVAPVAREEMPAAIDTAESRQSWDHEKWEYCRMLLRDVGETIRKLDVQALIVRLERELGRQQQTARFMQIGDAAEGKLRARKARVDGRVVRAFRRALDWSPDSVSWERYLRGWGRRACFVGKSLARVEIKIEESPRTGVVADVAWECFKLAREAPLGATEVVAERLGALIDGANEALRRGGKFATRGDGDHPQYFMLWFWQDLADACGFRVGDGNSVSPKVVDGQAGATGEVVPDSGSMKGARITEESSAEESRFYKEGNTWRITFAGLTVGEPDRLGLGYIHELIRRKGQRVGVQQLARVGGAVVEQDAEPEDTLDDAGKAHLEARLRELPALIELAQGEDPEEAGRLEIEETRIRGALAGASGMGGRRRSTGDPVESLRTRVGHAIRQALKPLEESHPALHAHLVESIKDPSGRQPAYLPTPDVAWILV